MNMFVLALTAKDFFHGADSFVLAISEDKETLEELKQKVEAEIKNGTRDYEISKKYDLGYFEADKWDNLIFEVLWAPVKSKSTESR